MSDTLAFVIDAPMQAWAASSRFQLRETGSWPTKSALVGIMAVVYGAMRRGEETLTDVDRISAGDMLRALDIQEALAAKRRAAEAAEAETVPPHPGEVAAETSSRAAPAENVTPLTLGDRKRGET